MQQHHNVSLPYLESQSQQGVCHIVALPFTLKSILRQKKNYANSEIFTMQEII
jgi:hypothetical protein